MASGSIPYAMMDIKRYLNMRMHFQVIGADCADSTDDYKYAAYLHQSYKWYTYCNKNTVCVPNAQVLLIKAYKVYRRIVEPVSV